MKSQIEAALYRLATNETKYDRRLNFALLVSALMIAYAAL